MAESDSQAVTMEEQAMDDAKNPGQQESAYGSLESSSQGPSQKGSYSGSKSLNSGSSHSSGFGDNTDFREKRLKEAKHKDHKRKKAKEKTEKLILKDKDEKEKDEKLRGVVGGGGGSGADGVTVSPGEEKEETRLAIETPSSLGTGVEEVAAVPFHCVTSQAEEERTDQPTLVYTQALNYIRKIKERSAEQGVPFASPALAQLPQDTDDVAEFLKSFKSARGFTVAISMQDGTVLQVSPTITDVLGFPKDMLVGQSFIDFVYPKDSINLSSKIIHGLNMPFCNNSLKDNYGTSFFCRMRVYHGLRSTGFGVRNKRTFYKPCKMVLRFHDAATTMDETASTCGPHSSLLLAEVIPIQSVYKVPEETPAMGTFSIRHSSSCNFSEYDPEAIPYLGHLPQDLTGNSVFDCYHPEDLPLLRTAYEDMVREQGKPQRSKPYRFRAFNGSWVTLQTEWLCFVNPWTKRIDSIIGQHRILKGPSDISIFLDPGDKVATPLPEEVMKEAQKAQTDIMELLAKPVATYKDPSKGPQEMRRRTLAHMMSSIVDELDSLQKDGSSAPASRTTATSTIPTAAIKDPTLTTRHPVNHLLLGGPNRPCSVQKGLESVTSTDSPSTYGHLNYSETIHRFFRSQPKTISSDESGDSKMEVSHVSSLASGNHKQSQTLSHSQTNSQSQSGSGSGDNCDHTRKSKSTGHGSGSGDTTGRTSCRSYRHVQLTEEVLNRHNADMQKIFMAGHHHHRPTSATVAGSTAQGVITAAKTYRDKARLKSVKKAMKRPGEKTLSGAGVKRSGGAMDQEASVNKQPFLASSAAGSGSSLKPPSAADPWLTGGDKQQPHMQSSGSVGAAGVGSLGAPSFPGIVPGFYFPPGTPSLSSIPSVTSISASRPPGTTLVMPPPQTTFIQPQGMAVPLQYIPGVMYQTVGPPLFNAPSLMLPNVVYQHTAATAAAAIQPHLTQVTVPMSDGEKHRSGAESEHDHDHNLLSAKLSTPHVHRPDSQATSVKAEPGSARGSTASASGKVISSHSHVAESIRSYLEDTTILSPGCAPKVSQFSQSTSVRAEAESIGSPGKQDKMAMDDREQRHENSSDMVMSLSSSVYSPGESKSTDDSMQNISDNSEYSEGMRGFGGRWGVHGRGRGRPVLNDPPWLEDVRLTPELLYKYQLETKELVNVLRHDMDKLKNVKQPSWVDDQLSSLYHELELEGSNPSLHLEEGFTSSSGEDQAGTSHQGVLVQQRRKRSSNYFSKMAMLHEEEAPLPPPSHYPPRQPAPETSGSSS